MSGFYSLPMTSGPNDFQVGEDELGNPVFLTPAGQRYTVKQQPANKGSYAKAALETLNEARKAPLESLGAVAKGIAQGVWSGVSAPGRAAAGEPVTYGDAAELAGMVSLPALAGRYDPAVANMGIRAYHGSPHDFDRFSMDKIGTGEGAQAYGHGLYFAEAEDVARQYRDALAPGMGDGALRAVGVSDGDLRSMRQFTQSGVDPDVALRDWLGWTGKKETPELRAAFMQEWGARDPGHMYEVNINADPADFLDWDAPLSEQPQKVRDWALDNMTTRGWGGDEVPVREVINQWESSGMDPWNDMGGIPETRVRGADIYHSAVNDARGLAIAAGDSASTAMRPSYGAASNELHQGAGIPGIKYYDGMSRAGGEGTRNYVVFDENLIDIVRKYGLAGIATAGALNAEKDQIRAYLDRAPGT